MNKRLKRVIASCAVSIAAIAGVGAFAAASSGAPTQACCGPRIL